MDVPEDLARRAVDVERAVLDFGGPIGKRGRREETCGVVDGGELDSEIRGKGRNVGRKMDGDVGCRGGDCRCAAVINTCLGAFEACVDKVFGGVCRVVDNEGFGGVTIDFIS
jgi:hypothetical protein